MRNPNDPIPGFEDEYTGTVGHEKAVHKTHFTMPELNLKKTKDDDSYEWVKIGIATYRLVKKDRKVGSKPEVKSG